MSTPMHSLLARIAIASSVMTAGSLISLPSAAQIPVTGGRITGEAAFFVPALGGDTVFFDLGTRTLRLETPNGVTVDSRFIPLDGSLEGVVNRLPTTGDSGTLRGTLSGRAFDVTGSPVFFSNRNTELTFTLNQFAPTLGNLAGTLITPSAPTDVANLFLPVVGVTLDPISAQSFVPQSGTLSAGSFDANLPGGVIDLPSNLRFGTPLFSEFSVPDVVLLGERLLNFTLSGSGIPNPPGTFGDPLGSFFDPFFAGGVRFSSGNAITNFDIQLDGTPLRITGSGTFATVIEIQGINPLSSASTLFLPGTSPLAPVVSYSVSGQGSGSVTNSEPLRLSSNNSATTFLFQDGLGNTASGVSQGITNLFIAGAQPFTVSSFSNFTPAPEFNAVVIDNAAIFTPTSVIAPPSLIAIPPQSAPRQIPDMEPAPNPVSPDNRETESGSSGGNLSSEPGTESTGGSNSGSQITRNISQTNIVNIIIEFTQVSIASTVNSTTPLLTLQNPALPNSTVFPTLNQVQVPLPDAVASNGNAVDKLLSGQNLSVRDATALVTGDLNQFLDDLLQATPVEAPASPLALPIASSNSIATDTRLDLDPSILAGSDSSSMMNWVSNFNATFSNQLNQAMADPVAFTQQQERRNQVLGALVGAELAWDNVMQDINERDERMQLDAANRSADMAIWRIENGMLP